MPIFYRFFCCLPACYSAVFTANILDCADILRDAIPIERARVIWLLREIAKNINEKPRRAHPKAYHYARDQLHRSKTADLFQDAIDFTLFSSLL